MNKREKVVTESILHLDEAYRHLEAAAKNDDWKRTGSAMALVSQVKSNLKNFISGHVRDYGEGG